MLPDATPSALARHTSNKTGPIILYPSVRDFVRHVKHSRPPSPHSPDHHPGPSEAGSAMLHYITLKERQLRGIRQISKRQKIDLAPPILSPYALTAILRRVAHLLNDGLKYTVDYQSAADGKNLRRRMATGEFPPETSKRSCKLVIDSGRPPEHLTSALPTYMQDFLQEFQECKLRASDRSESPPPIHPSPDDFVPAELPVELPVHPPAQVPDHLTHSEVFQRAHEGQSPFCVMQPAGARLSVRDYLEFRFPSNADRTDFNSCHCLLAHYHGKKPNQIIELLIDVCNDSKRTKNWRDALKNYLWNWLYLFPEDWEHLRIRDFFIEVGIKPPRGAFDVFTSPALREYVQSRKSKHIPREKVDIDLGLVPKAIVKRLTAIELPLLKAVRCRDLIALDQVSKETSEKDWIFRYLDRLDRTIKAIRKSITNEDSLEKLVRVMIECHRYSNCQLVYEILNGAADAWAERERRVACESKLDLCEIRTANQLIRMFEPKQNSSPDDCVRLVRDMSVGLYTDQTLPLILPVLRQIREFLMLDSTRGMEDDSQGMDLKRVLEFHRHCRLILQDWGAAYEESLTSPPASPSSAKPQPMRPLLPPKARAKAPPGERAPWPNHQSALSVPENDAQKSVVEPPAKQEPAGEWPPGREMPQFPPSNRGRRQQRRKPAQSDTATRRPTP
jgi:hypothetical protein